MKRISLVISAFSVFLLGAPQAVICQEIGALRAGELIRLSVDSPSIQRIEGRLVSMTAATVVLRDAATVRPVGFSTIKLLEVKRRSGRSFMKSVGVGTLIGAAAGAIIGVTYSEGKGDGFSPAGVALIMSIFGGGAGAAAGALYGVCCGYRWEPVPLDHSTRALSRKP